MSHPHRFVVSPSLCLSALLCALMTAGAAVTAFGADAPAQCTRDWAKDKVQNTSFKVIGLGLSNLPDARQAQDEAKAEAIKDILMQLKTSAESKATIEKSTSSASFNSEAVLSSKLDDLKGLKPVRSGSNAEEHIAHCEVYEFNVQAAYGEMRGKVSGLIERLEAATEDGADPFAAMKGYAGFKQAVDDAKPDLARADTFKTVLGAPGPGWQEQADKQLIAIEGSIRKMKDKIWFLLPQGKFESASADVQSKLANSGVHVAENASDMADDAFPVRVDIKEIGTPRKSKTSLGLTVTRKVAVSLVNMKTKKTLSMNRGVSVVGTSASGDESDAMANSDSQLTAAIVDAINAFMPQLTQN